MLEAGHESHGDGGHVMPRGHGLPLYLLLQSPDDVASPGLVSQDGEEHLGVHVGVLSVADHGGTLRQVLGHRLGGGGQVGRHRGLEYPGKDLYLLGRGADAGDLALEAGVADQLDGEVEHEAVGVVLRQPVDQGPPGGVSGGEAV